MYAIPYLTVFGVIRVLLTSSEATVYDSGPTSWVFSQLCTALCKSEKRGILP